MTQPDVAKYEELLNDINTYKEQYTKQTIRNETIMEKLAADYGVKTIEEAKDKVKELEEEADMLANKYNKELVKVEVIRDNIKEAIA